MHFLIKQFWVQILVCLMLKAAQGIMLRASTEDLSLKWGDEQLLYRRGWLRTEGGSQGLCSGSSLVFCNRPITGDSLGNAGSQQRISLDSYGESYFFRTLSLVLSRRAQSYSVYPVVDVHKKRGQKETHTFRLSLFKVQLHLILNPLSKTVYYA